MHIHALIPNALEYRPHTNTLPCVCISCVTLVFDAGALWDQYVQCAAVEDSNSGNRACCACFEPPFCPFWPNLPSDDTGYCAAACAADAADPVCQQLAAGCGHNLRDLYNAEWGERRCSEADIRSGTCGLCMRPVWCDDAAYGTPITTAQEWMRRFTDKPFLTQDHQCKFKASQKSLFIESAHALMSAVKRDESGSVWDPASRMESKREPGAMWDRFTWNEVNMYMDGGVADGGLQHALARNLIGLLDVQGRWGYQLDVVARRLGELGLDVPKVTMTMDGYNRLDSWDPDHDADLLSWPYQLTRL